jgi:hypothetical protein
MRKPLAIQRELPRFTVAAIIPTIAWKPTVSTDRLAGTIPPLIPMVKCR